MSGGPPGDAPRRPLSGLPSKQPPPAWLSLLDGFELRVTPRHGADGRDATMAATCLACGETVHETWAQRGYFTTTTLGDLARAAQRHSGQCGAVR